MFARLMLKMRSMIKENVARIRKSLNYVLSPMVVIFNITGQHDGQNFNLLATINRAAAIYENNIRQISGKNCCEKSRKNYGLTSG